MNSLNTPADELRERVEIKLLWLTHTYSPNVKKSLEDCVLELIADTCNQVIGEDEPMKTLREDKWPSSPPYKRNKLRAEQRSRLAQLTAQPKDNGGKQ